MKEYVLDANPLIRLYRSLPGIEIAERILREAREEKALLSISVVNLSEVFCVLARYLAPEDAMRRIEAVRRALQVEILDEAAAFKAAELRIRYKLSFADSCAAELALRRKATLVTADPEFQKLGKQLKIMALPRHSK